MARPLPGGAGGSPETWIERPGHAEPEPIVVEGADEVEEAKDEVVAASTLDDAAESEAPQRTVSGFSDRREGRSTGRADQEV
jgi:hypothetical protein